MATNYEIMEQIWDKITKQEDGKTICYTSADLDYLYFEGFVDAVKFSHTKWVKAFKPFKKKDKYILNKDQFMSLRQFRYVGSTEFFDPMKIREGAWADEELKILYDRTISKFIDWPENEYWNTIKALKKAGGFDQDGDLIINQDVKVGIASLVNFFPTPRTRLLNKMKFIKEKGEAAYAVSQTAKETSQFSAGKSAVETAMASLQKLQDTTCSTKQPDKEKPEAEDSGIDIKKLRKPGGKVFG